MTKSTRTYSEPLIHNERAYAAAIDSRIKANRRKGAERRWLADNADALRARDFLLAQGAYEPTESVDRFGHSRWTDHPVRRAAHGDFFAKMIDTLNEWGALSDGQTAAVIKMIERSEQRLAERETAKAAQRDTARHIGEIGERRDFDLTVLFRTSFETQFGYTHIYVMEAGDKNVVVYKGSTRLATVSSDNRSQYAEKGDRVKFKATIKAHDVRDGVAQTVVARPKAI